MLQCGPIQIPRAGKKRSTFSTFSPGEEFFGWNSGVAIGKVLIQDAFQIGAGSPFEMKFVLLQEAQAGSNDLGLIVEAPGGDKTLNHLLKVRSNDFAHSC